MTSTEEKPDVVLREFVDDNDGLTKKDVSAQALAKGQGTSGYEKLTIWQTIRAFKMNCLVCFLMTLSAATDGYQLGMLGGIIANPGFVAQFATKTNDAGERILAAPILSAWSAIGSIGQIIGMTTLPFLSDRFGRKAAMYYYWFLLAVSIALECAAREWRLWLVAKLFGGLGVGCMQSTIPTYIAEVAPTRVRGVLLMCYSLWWITGQFFAPVALQVMSETRPEDYLTPIYTQWSQVGLMLLIYLVVPESPAWLASRGREELGKKTLEKLNRGVPSYDAEHQYYLLNIMIEHERAVAAETRQEKWYAIFKGQNGFRTTISCWTLMSQQFVGLSLLAGYQTYFFQQAGVQDPFAVTCITSGINIAFTLLIMYLADAWGRRWIACSGITLCWGSCVLIGILGVVPTNAVINKLLVLFAVLWNIGLTANGATGWGFIGEISSQRLRPYTAGFAAASTCVVGVVMGVLVPYMINETEWDWGLKTAWFYAGLGLPFMVAMWFLIPETKSRTSAELDELFERKIKPWRFHKTLTATQRIVQVAEEKRA